MNRRGPGSLLFAGAAIGLAVVLGGTLLLGSAVPPEAEAMQTGALAARGNAASVPQPGPTIDVEARTPADARPSLRLTIVDATSHTPLAGATVLARRHGAPAAELTTDAEGVTIVRPYDRAALRLTIRNRGHQALDANLPAVADDRATVALQQAGALIVRVTDAEAAAANVGIELLPPPNLAVGPAGDQVADGPIPELALADGVYSVANATDEERFVNALARGRCLERRRVTDERGQVQWDDLPAGAGYRFRILPPRHGDTDPPHEQARLAPEDDGVVVRRAPPPGLSGSLTIALDSPTIASATLTNDGTVRGRLAARPGCVPLQLLAVTRAGGGNVREVTAVDLTDTTTCDADGAFVFRDVRPGIYVLRSRWVAAVGTIALASLTLKVPPGADVDLGDVAAMAGSTLTLRAQLTDQNGRQLAPDAVFRDAGKALARVLVVSRPESRLLADTIAEESLVPFGARLQLCGLPAGLVRVTVSPEVGTERLEEVVDLPVEPSEISLPREGCVDVPLRVVMGRAIALVGHDERGNAINPMQLTLRNLATGRIGTCRVAGEDEAMRVTLRDGDHELFAAVRAGAIDLYTMERVAVPRPEQAPLALTFRRAASVHGRLTTATGQPVAGRMLRWTLPGWATAGAPWLFCAVTDADGRFDVHGAPVGFRLEPASDTPELPLLVAGDNESLLIDVAR